MPFQAGTAEQMAELREKARIARLAKKQEREANKHKYKLEYLDSCHWATLASRYKVKMPNAEEPADMTTIRKYIKRTGITTDLWNEHYTGMMYFLKHNPLWTKYAVVGLMLELRDEHDRK